MYFLSEWNFRFYPLYYTKEYGKLQEDMGDFVYDS